MRGDTATLAAAAVDSDLRARAAAAGLSLLSSRADAKPDEPGAANPGIGTRIEDQAVVEGQNEALRALLVALETGRADGAGRRPRGRARRRRRAAPGDPQAPRLRMSLTLSAYWRSRRPPP